MARAKPGTVQIRLTLLDAEGFEFKSEDRVNPIRIHDGCNIITENVGKDKMT